MYEIEFTDSGIHFELVVERKIIQLVGESAIGKTFFFEALQRTLDSLRENIPRPKGERLFLHSGRILVVLADRYMDNHLKNILSGVFKDYIICIDCFESVMCKYPDIASYMLHDSSNRYVIAGRGALTKLHLTILNTCIPIFEEKSSTLYFTPVVQEGLRCII